MNPNETNLMDAVAVSLEISESALCRIWLIGPGDLCATCPLAGECPDRRRCLHLVASAGLTRQLDGPFHRFPLGAREVGRVASSRKALVLNQDVETSGLADPLWFRRHGIVSFGAFPIHRDGHGLGVLAVFARRPLGERAALAFSALARLAAAPPIDATSTAISSGASAASAETTDHETPPLETPESGRVASMADVQRKAILLALDRTGGKVSGPGGAAELLGMKSTTLESRLRKLGVRKPPRPRLR